MFSGFFFQSDSELEDFERQIIKRFPEVDVSTQYYYSTDKTCTLRDDVMP